ncbi:TonB-dependent receptor plug domain-containing protein [Marinibactrum halimedae]|uniref:Ferric enterobactin receptor n=1 Tax=Marinibactrum halimedae TaxID=1444977 RepID=A0AA37T4A4_9GAMM|nr:TonB-dependent receptor [Marinibactrum halimedae]MCD9461210.1 TonB-dependent receptor [Marinibactrum halimedae]GLS25276.1 ferric enterobactin receptor [Marinibactrum halimedae]
MKSLASKPFISRPLALVTAISAAGGFFSTPTFAQQDTALEEVVVTGSRREPRSVFDSAAPIDVIGGEEFRNQGGSDMTSLIRNSVPSFNVNAQPISDAATISRPANLRGLAPDHTLVLVNNKRRHRAAVISWQGNGVSDGAQGPDISVIPSIALRQVEVLRDGASAQYGSDAIAGVLNFILKDASEGGSFEAKYGQYSEDSSEDRHSVAANIGLPFTANGFFNVSAEFSEAAATSRSVQRSDAQALIDAGNTAVANPAQVWGAPEVRDEVKTFFNMGVDLDTDQQFYSFGNYARKEVEGGFYFRNPETRTGVFFDGENPLIADLTDDGTGNCGIDVQAALTDPDCFTFQEMFPGGFTPSFGGNVIDASLVAGVKGTLSNDLYYDVSASVGMNDADFFISNTVNASLGPDTPTDFDPGDYTQTETNFNIDLAYPVDVGLASDLNIAGGFEWRDETFEVTAGDEESYEIGPYALQDFSSGSNGFPGFGPIAAGDWSRKNIAAYVDLEVDVLENWMINGAFRWEDFDDFGSTSNFKLATHWQVNDVFALRASYSTGFRAPTPGQSNAFNVSTEINSETGQLENRGAIPSTNPVAVFVGGETLQPEESENATLGAIFTFDNLSVTVDFFDIKVKDRIALSQDFNLTDQERADLIASGVTFAGDLQAFRFFANDFDTTTSGVDIVATYSLESDLGATDFSFAFNQTETEVDDFTPEIISAGRIRELEEGLPETRWNIGVSHMTESIRASLRYSYYDDWFDSEEGLTFDGYGMVDFEGAYSFENGLTTIFGIDNVFDEYPDESPNATNFGNQYSQFAPGGFFGRFMYLRLTYDF